MCATSLTSYQFVHYMYVLRKDHQVFGMIGNWVDAYTCSLHSQIQETNMFVEGDRPVGGVSVDGFTGKLCFDQVLDQSDFHNRMAEVEAFNRY